MNVPIAYMFCLVHFLFDLAPIQLRASENGHPKNLGNFEFLKFLKLVAYPVDPHNIWQSIKKIPRFHPYMVIVRSGRTIALKGQLPVGLELQCQTSGVSAVPTV